MNKVKEKLSIINIKIGELIGKPIIIIYYPKSIIRNGTIIFHLKNPVVDSRSLLQGTKAFILTLDEGKT